MAAAAKFNFPIPNPLTSFPFLLSAEWIQSIFMSHTKSKNKKNEMEKRNENFSTCVGSFLVERQKKNVEENSFKVVGESGQKKMYKKGAKWQVAGNNLCMCGWTRARQRGKIGGAWT